MKTETEVVEPGLSSVFRCFSPLLWLATVSICVVCGSAVSLSGAFALAEDSKDAALIATFLPGSWTVKVSGVGSATGVALVEVYDLP